MAAPESSPTVFSVWHSIPLYLRILAGLLIGLIIGVIFGPQAGVLEIPSKIILQLLQVLAPPLVFVAVVQALMHAQIPKSAATTLVFLLILNTVVAILVGMFVANTLQPGRHTQPLEAHDPAREKPDILKQVLDNVPKSLLGPFADGGKVLSVIVVALAFGIAVRKLQSERKKLAADLIELAFQLLITVLHWIIEIIPFGVLCTVAAIVGKEGFGPILSLGWFVAAVIIALLLQSAYYLLRIQFGCWASPLHVLRGMRDALVMAFSTASSTATMPVTYACLRNKVGLRERSATLGSLVGANFNNDGTALYEAMAALFISQMLGRTLDFRQQILVVLTSIGASVGAAGIPEAGLVTMTLVFTAVGLPPELILPLFAVDWFLDRCRTTVNVLGDVNVSCMLDGRERELPHPDPAKKELGEIA